MNKFDNRDMEDIVTFLTKFLALSRVEILEYYDKSSSYLKDLISYKNIDLNKELSAETESTKVITLEKMLKAIKTGLNTIGISIERLTEIQDHFLNTISTEKETFYSYNSYLESYLKIYIYKILFEIIIEYLLDLDSKKIENLNLFNLLPQHFINKLDKFKESYSVPPQVKQLLNQRDLDDFINFTNLTVDIKEISMSPNEGSPPIEENVKKTQIKDEELHEIPDILVQLKKAKSDSIETLKSPRKELHEPALEEVKEEKRVFFDYFGNFSPIHPEIIKSFEIHITNFINSRVINPEFLDLEALFYYISILKMLNIDFPFTSIEIVEILKNYINKEVFCSSKIDPPDSKNNFYGLAILSEIDLLNKTDIIDLREIEKFLELELKRFIPEKLGLNFYSLLGLKFLKKNRAIEIDKNLYSKSVLNLNLKNLEESKPILDIYNQLAFLKLLDKNVDLQSFKKNYITELKKKLNSNGSINNLITDSAMSLLILDLLNLEKVESQVCNGLLNFIMTSTNFFDVENLNKDFNWRNNKLAYKIELKILFFSLLASSQYAPLIS